ncbi:MAG: hypothetical protein ACTH7L_06585 [Psychrobacter alimentarius]
MSISLANLFDFFRSRKEPENEHEKSIQLLQTMQWSKLCWDESWEDVIELESLLPKAGKTYPIKLDENEEYAEEGKAYILWSPPHSELNGWWDKRPSEILKSYVLEGILSNAVSNYEKREYFFDFQIERYTRLINYFSEIPETKISPLSTVGQGNGSSRIQWQNADDLQKYNLGDYLYLSGIECESHLELILSCIENRWYVHYSATLHYPAHYETLITKYHLKSKEQKLIETLIKKANDITDNSMDSLEDNKIYGAEYW